MTQSGVTAPAGSGQSYHAPDPRDGLVYVMTHEIDLAERVALATGRPLLLRGDPGSGKSSLAAHVAQRRGWRYYEHVVTSRTQARDLLWTFDSVRRLADAEAGARSSTTTTTWSQASCGGLSRAGRRRAGAHPMACG